MTWSHFLIYSLFPVVKWETEQATVKLLDDVSNGEIEEETEEPEGEENVCEETKIILDSNSVVESKSINKLSSDTKDSLATTEQSSDNENNHKQLETNNSDKQNVNL